MIKTICYGTERHWSDRTDAVRWFLECVSASEGSEKERYTNILTQLLSGAEVATDGDEVVSQCVDIKHSVC